MSKKIDLQDLASWNRLLSTERTCITRQEAVEFLMELSGLTPPGLAPLPLNATDDEIEAFESITLFDILMSEVDRAESQYDIARFGDEPSSESVIAEKKENIKQSKLIYQQARGFLRTIDDELAKGVLRVPSGGMRGDLTMISFEEWVELGNRSSDSGKPETAKMPRTKQLRQEEAIKKVLISHGYDLFDLPKEDNGLSGLRKEIRNELLSMSDLFANRAIYEKAWDRLRARDNPKEIAFSKTTHPQKSS